MFLPRRLVLSFALLAAATLATPFGHAQDHWVGTWAASPVALKNPAGKFVAGADGATVRQIVHISLGGPSVRVIFTNEFGLEPLTVGAAAIAISAGGGKVTGSLPLTFSGHPSIIIPPGALALSDAAPLKVAPFADLAVSLFLPDGPLTQITQHGAAYQTSYFVMGNAAGMASLDTPKPTHNWVFLKGVDVSAPSDAAAIVTFGDSITDGAHSTPDTNARWPDILARRLAADKKTAHLGVLNQGIGGNRILHDNTGPNALARFDRDVIAQTGVKYVILLESINDIGHAAQLKDPFDIVSADDLIGGLSQLATRAHAHGIKVFGATLTPYVGAAYASPAGETMRQAVNQWIRTSKELDGVVDFDKVTTDPAHPGMLLPVADSGDHLHPGDAGYKIMGDSIDLKLFSK